MIAIILASALVNGNLDNVSTHIPEMQLRPGTFTGKKMTQEAKDAYRRIGVDYIVARTLLEEGRPQDALARLLPWRERIVTREAIEESIDNAKASNCQLFFMCYIAAEDWQGAVSMAEDRYRYLEDIETTEPNPVDAFRLVAAYYLSGEEQQAWELFQIKLREQGTKGYEYYFTDTKDEALDRENFGYSLMLAAARETWSDTLTQQVFLEKAIEERPHDALANRNMARSLDGSGDLAGAVRYYGVVREHGSAEEAKDAARACKLIEWRIAFRARVASGG